MEFHNLGVEFRKQHSIICLAIFYALKHKSEFVFWGPGPEKCEKASQSHFFTPKRTFCSKVIFCKKVTLVPKSRFWGIQVEFHTIWARNYYCFVHFPGSVVSVTRKSHFMKNFAFSRDFHQKSEFYVILQLFAPRHENTLGFCHPSNGFYCHFVIFHKIENGNRNQHFSEND